MLSVIVASVLYWHSSRTAVFMLLWPVFCQGCSRLQNLLFAELDIVQGLYCSSGHPWNHDVCMPMHASGGIHRKHTLRQSCTASLPPSAEVRSLLVRLELVSQLALLELLGEALVIAPEQADVRDIEQHHGQPFQPKSATSN